MADQWYYTKGGKQHGPVSEEELRRLAASRELQPSDFVWKVGMSQWTESRNVAGLFPDRPPPFPKAGPALSPKSGFIFCRTCGRKVNSQAVVCVGCGVPPLSGNQFCQSCGAASLPAATICVKCGVALAKMTVLAKDAIVASIPPKDPLLMALLSGCCITGLGQIVLGQIGKGIAVVLIAVTLAAITGGFSAFITQPVVAIDAYLIAKKLKAGKSVTPWEFF